MSVAALLESAQAAGVRLSLNGDKVRVQADREPPADLLARLRSRRHELLAELRAKQFGARPPELYGTLGAYERLRLELLARPEIRFACEVMDPDADPVLVAVAVRGAGFATLRLPKAKYGEAEVLVIVHREPRR